MEQLIFLYLLAFPFGQLGRFEVVPGVTLHAVDLLVGFVAITWILRWLGKKKREYPALARPFLAFSIVAAFSLAINAGGHTPAEVFVGSLYLVRFLAYILFYFAVWELLRRKNLAKTLFDSLMVVGAFIAALGLVQYIFLPDTRSLLVYGWDEHLSRLIGAFLDPGFIGILLVFFTLLVLSRRWQGRERRLGWALFILGFSALALTYSRASYLAFLAGLVSLYIVRRNLKLLLGGVALIILTLFILPRPGGEGVRLERTSTIFSRIESYEKALQAGIDKPLFGIGFNLYRYAVAKEPSHSGAGADSSLLFVFATTGIVGILTYFALWWRILASGWRSRKTPEGLALFASSLALLAHSLFNNTLFYPWILGWLAILLALQED